MTELQQVLDEQITVDRSPELMRGVHPGGSSSGSGIDLAFSEVTEQDLVLGVRGDGANCPLARAFKRTFPMIIDINLSGEHPWAVTVERGRQELRLSADVIDWIGKYDRGEWVPTLRVIFTA